LGGVPAVRDVCDVLPGRRCVRGQPDRRALRHVRVAVLPASESPEALHSCYSDGRPRGEDALAPAPQETPTRRSLRPTTTPASPSLWNLEASGIHAMLRIAHVRVCFCARLMVLLYPVICLMCQRRRTASDGGVDGEAVVEYVEACGDGGQA
jgi:hypothetical protein